MSQETQWTTFAEGWMDWAGLFNEPRNYNRLAVALGKFDGCTQPWEQYIEFARGYTEHYHEMHDVRLLAHKEALEILGFTFVYTGQRWVVQAEALEFGESTLAKTIEAAEAWAIPLMGVWEWYRRCAKRKQDGADHVQNL